MPCPLIIQSCVKLLVLLPLLFALLGLSACSTVAYYHQAVRGHLDLSSRRQPITELIADEQTPTELRERLRTVQQIRDFASEQLKLPDNGSYRSYADLERDAATWLVSAAPELSLQAQRWCYLVVGCLTYRGYFKQEAAETFASELRTRGLEVAVTPSAAYSTLGQFDDPVLNTMLTFDDPELAGLLFHELAHQVLYLKGDAMFSESFATMVEQVGRRQWLEQRGQRLERNLIAHDNFDPKQRETMFINRLLQTRSELDDIYQRQLSNDLKHVEKQRVLKQLRADYQLLKQGWDGYTGFDHWFVNNGPNNARLALLATYQLNVPAFETLFVRNDTDWERFYGAVRELARQPAVERQQQLCELAGTADCDEPEADDRVASPIQQSPASLATDRDTPETPTKAR